ncbi:type II toxin-antitoxin system RelE/ParE family toxin [Stenotrophomonas sp. Iso1]|uniref:type II toxin-antitoxin system RelE/ParE family toxin n=1 Tax=Stenotrophomonas sp. Iso1 TaxID=2977283 RepID=UPI0022B78A1A|nr:type II toxin-antitoxin system RelE/ParE family toxin [Stenotrophomonas sp. Iso1]
MSNPSTSPKHSTPELWNERRDGWAATLLSALLHLLMLLLLLHSNPPVVSSPQGSSGGGRVKVDFVGNAPPSPQPQQVPPQQKPSDTPRSQRKPLTHRRSDNRKPVREARYIEPPSEPDQEENPTPAQAPAQAASPAAAAPSETVPRRPQTWTGRPPGWVEKPTTSDDDGRSAGQGDRSEGNRVDRSAGQPAMEVGGYQIIYDLLSETRLRARMEEGMKELLIPLPGTTYVMVCPAEVALRRGSSKCRMLPADSPELQAMGDARQFVIVMYVYRYGELLWRGPGPYR